MDILRALEAKQNADRAVNENNIAHAIELYTLSIQLNPNDEETYLRRAACYVQQRHLTDALADCEECLRIRPGRIDCLLLKGNIALEQLDYRTARAVFEEVLGIEPNNEAARVGLQNAIALRNNERLIPERPQQRRAPPQEQPQRRSRSWGKIIGTIAGAAVAGVGAIVAAPVVLTAVGFTSAGIAAGSLAASMMSASAIAGGGGVAAGSAVAILQSVGAAGLGLTGMAAVGGAGAAVGAGAGAVAGHVVDNANEEREEQN